MQTLKSSVQTVLRRAGIYERVKESCLYDCYWWLADRRIINERAAEVEFYRRLLAGFRKGALIFDIGANHGQKTDIFLRLGARVVAIEPDEFNQCVLKQKFLSYRLARKPVTIVGKAVSDKNAVETMWIDAPGSAKNTLSQKWVETLREDTERFGTSLGFCQKREVSTTTMEDLIDCYGEPFFIKIDVEGYEARVLRGLKRAVRYLSFEINLPEFRSEGLECVGLLAEVATGGEFNFAANCQGGLAMEKWLGAPEFMPVLNSCGEKSIEVFWRTPER